MRLTASPYLVDSRIFPQPLTSMKTSALHIIWILVAGAAFGAGWFLRPTPEIGDPSVSSGTGPAVTSTAGTAAGQSEGVQKFGGTSEKIGVQKYFDGNGIIRAKDMGRAMRDALKESDPLKSNLLFTQLLSELTPDNIDSALAALREAPQGWEMWQKMGLFVGAWGKLDGLAALDYAKEMQGPGRMFGSAAALSGWASIDPDAAIAWADENQSEGRENIMAKAGILRGLAISDPARATEYLQNLPENTEGLDRLVDTVANEQMKQGMDSATTWAASLSTDALKKEAFEQLGDEYARQDPVKAASWIESYADNAYTSEAVEEIADEWAEIDPGAAVAWASKLPEATQATAMESAFQEWEESDAEGASAYLQNMESSPAKDAAIAGFVSDLGKDEPAAAIQWANTIENEATRTEALTDVAKDWFNEDADAAGSWIETSGLPVESVKEITTPRDNRGDMFRRMMGR
ncbi:MAG: hypothetical protein ACI9R3_001953 [Verrucomicrobiales bacterium]|jgi:hypothetical protein